MAFSCVCSVQEWGSWALPSVWWKGICVCGGGFAHWLVGGPLLQLTNAVERSFPLFLFILGQCLPISVLNNVSEGNFVFPHPLKIEVGYVDHENWMLRVKVLQVFCIVLVHASRLAARTKSMFEILTSVEQGSPPLTSFETHHPLWLCFLCRRNSEL